MADFVTDARSCCTPGASIQPFLRDDPRSKANTSVILVNTNWSEKLAKVLPQGTQLRVQHALVSGDWAVVELRSLAAIYAGAYVFGKTETRTKVVEGRARKTDGHFKPQSSWTVLIREHHPSYISWERYERNQEIIASNSNMKSRMLRKSGRGGRSLLSGILRCRRCGRHYRCQRRGF
jgi:hypothetical protein